MAANSVRAHRVLSLRRQRVARVPSAGSPQRTRQTLNAEAMFYRPPRRPSRGLQLTTTPPCSRISRSKPLVARRPPSRWSTARLARVSFASTVRASRANARDAERCAKTFRVHRRRRWRASARSDAISRVRAARVADIWSIGVSARSDDRSCAAPDPGNTPGARRRHRVFPRAKRRSSRLRFARAPLSSTSSTPPPLFSERATDLSTSPRRRLSSALTQARPSS